MVEILQAGRRCLRQLVGPTQYETQHNKISTVLIGTSIVYTVKQGIWILVEVSVNNSHLISVAMKLDRAMIISHFDSRRMGVQERSMLGRLVTAR
jgi:hypothetical protein